MVRNRARTRVAADAVVVTCAWIGSLVAPAGRAATLDEENASYRLVTVMAPEAVRDSRDTGWKPPPDGLMLEVSGITALADGRLAVATRKGEIWLVTGAADDPPDDVRYHRFASGLHEPLGLEFRDAAFWTAQRSELTRIADTDGDGVADDYATAAKGWGVTGHYHEYAYGPKPDGDGTFWLTLNTGLNLKDEHLDGTVLDAALGYRQGAWRGWAVEAPDAGEGAIVPVCGGLRSPSGLGRSATGEMFATDQQGNWVATNSLVHLRRGAFFGHPESLASRGLPGSTLATVGPVVEGLPWPEAVEKMPFLTPPAVWFPYRTAGQSATDVMLDASGGRFGPFTGQLFVGEFTQAAVQRVFLEEVDGVWQGACFPFRSGFASAVLRLAQGNDGSVYAGLTNRGWSSLGGAAYGLQRLVWTGRTPFEIREMRARPDGFDLVFTLPVDPPTAEDPGSYALSSHTYLYHSQYGSDPIDRRDLTVRSAQVSADGLSVRLVVDGLRPLHVHELEAPGVRDREGRSLVHPWAAYTLVKRPRAEAAAAASMGDSLAGVRDAGVRPVDDIQLATRTTVPSAADTVPAVRDEAGYRSTIEPFFRDHCLGCHGPTKPEGDFSLDASALGDDFGDPVMRGRWREVVNVLDGHQMPPDTEPRPDPDRVAAVVDWITARAVAAEAARREATVVLRRLNRAEYAATIRDLVGVDFDASIFPQDPPAGGFDNNGAALTISPMQMDQYLAAADEIVSRALVEGERPEPVRWRFDPEPGSSDRTRVRLGDRNNPIVKAGHNRHEGEWVVVRNEHWDQFNVRDFRVPHAGTYAIRVRVAGRSPGREDVVRSAETILAERRDKQDRERPDRAEQNRQQMERDLVHFAEDRMYDYGPARLKLVLQLGSQPRTVAEFDVPGSIDEAEVREFHVRFTTETAGVTLGYAYSIPKVLENFWMQGRDDFARPEAFIDWIEIEGPLVDAWPPASHTGILDPEAVAASDETAAARKVLARFMTEAWRRPVEPDEVDAKLALFSAARAAGLSFVASIRRPLVAVLVSPHFLYLDESRAAAPDAHALAARLSYFLWSSQPDAELRRLADAGSLTNPAVREEQVDRLLADQRSDRLVTNFVGQWLGLREVGANPPAADLFPHYDRHLEESIVRESEAFFAEFLHGDLDARGLIASDFVTINERLARFYGIPGVRGDTFRRVEVPPDVRRGGIVTQASILTITSNGTRTSPVKRGTWILKNLLDTDPGLPVANAGEIAPKVPGIDKATVRQRLEAHRTLPQCARCHARIDPLGFALENYDASGAWRDREGFGYKGRVQPNDPPIDASSRMPDGRTIDGVEGLQRAMLEDDGRFLEALAARMLTYALGRELGLADRPTVARCVARMRAEGTTVRALVKAIVSSDAFAAK